MDGLVFALFVIIGFLSYKIITKVLDNMVAEVKRRRESEDDSE